MKTLQSPRQVATQTPAQTASAIAPPARCAQLISGVFFLAVFLIAAPAAEAQTHTITLTGPAFITETNADANTRYTLTRSGPPLAESILVITVTIVPGGATAADFSGGSLPASQVTYSGAGIASSHRTFDIGIASDSAMEDNEEFTISFSVLSASTISASDVNLPGDFTVTILANDGYAAVAIADAADVQEGGETTFTVTLTDGDPDLVYPVTVAWTASIGGAMGGTPAPASGSLDFAAGQTTGGITVGVPFNTDLGDDDSRTLTVTITPPAGITATDNMGTATVNYITAAHTISIADATVNEGAAEVTV